MFSLPRYNISESNCLWRPSSAPRSNNSESKFRARPEVITLNLRRESWAYEIGLHIGCGDQPARERCPQARSPPCARRLRPLAPTLAMHLRKDKRVTSQWCCEPSVVVGSQHTHTHRMESQKEGINPSARSRKT